MKSDEDENNSHGTAVQREERVKKEFAGNVSLRPHLRHMVEASLCFPDVKQSDGKESQSSKEGRMETIAA
jgi:hypothetical protein